MDGVALFVMDRKKHAHVERVFPMAFVLSGHVKLFPCLEKLRCLLTEGPSAKIVDCDAQLEVLQVVWQTSDPQSSQIRPVVARSLPEYYVGGRRILS